jgi:hypothetical protein
MLIGVCRIFLVCFVFAVLSNVSLLYYLYYYILYYIIIFLCYAKENHFMKLHFECLQCKTLAWKLTQYQEIL